MSICKFSSLIPVRVVNKGCCYSTYDSFLKDNFPYLLDLFKFSKGVSNGDCGYLVGMGDHPIFQKEIVCVVKNLDRVFLIELRGLELLED